MRISDTELVAIGSIANFFGRRYGAYNINRLLNSFGITDVPLLTNKTEKVAHVLRKFISNPQAFCSFMTALLGIHSLDKGDTTVLNSYLKTLGYQIKEGIVTTTALEDIVSFVKLPPNLTEEAHRMAEAYTILYFLENQLRAFIAERMNAVYGADWWKNKVSPNIRTECEKRKERERLSPWHEVKEANPLMVYNF